MTDQQNYQYFWLERVAEGVYAGIADRDAGTVANVGIVDLGESVLVVDSFMLPQAARTLLAAIEHLLGKRVGYLLNTHAHDDHFIGNYLFPAETCVVSTGRCRELIVEYGNELPEAIAETAEYVAELKQRLGEAASAADQRLIEQSLTRFSRYLEAADEIEIRPPDLVFDTRLVIHGSQRRAELLFYGAGHTSSDAILYLPDDRIVFSGDLALVNTQPFLLDSDPDSWRETLGKIEELDFATLVPGHGPVGDKANVAQIREYLDKMEGLVQAQIDSGGTIDDLVAQPVPVEFEGWSGGAYQHNLRFLFERLTEN